MIHAPSRDICHHTGRPGLQRLRWLLMRSSPLKVTVISWKLGVYMAENRKSRRERERGRVD